MPGSECLLTTLKNNMDFIMIDAALFDSLLEILNKLVGVANKIRNNEKDAVLEQQLDGQEVCEILDVTKRTLQTLRETGKIAYTMVKHKTYYRPKDMQVFLDSSIKKEVYEKSVRRTSNFFTGIS